MDPAALGTLIIGLEAGRSEQSDRPRRPGYLNKSAVRPCGPRRQVAQPRRSPRAADHAGSTGLNPALAVRRRRSLPGPTGA